jgi:hypothetical protein
MHKNIIPARRQLLAAAVFALAAPAFAWNFGLGESVQGSGKIRSEARKADHFSGLEVSVPGEVELRVGTGEGVSIETDDNILPLIETRVENGTLEIRPARDNLNLRAHTMRITVNAREIDHLSLAGSGSITADTLRARSFKASLAGSGSIKARAIEGDNLAIKVAGSGDLSVGGGNVKDMKISIAGSGDVDVGKLKAVDVRVKTAGSGNSTVWASGSLDVSVAGSGDVNYYGDARVSRSVMGSGDVRRLGGAPR